jgi:hypothetical protein
MRERRIESRMEAAKGAATEAEAAVLDAAMIGQVVEGMMLRLMNGSESDSARIQAAKLLLERIGNVTREDDEAQRREAEEREAAIAEARGILAEIAAARLAGVSEPPALADDGASGATDAAVEAGT